MTSLSLGCSLAARGQEQVRILKTMPKSHALLKNLRLLHLYIGVFISPAILFFAFTGALQTFSLHETVRGSDYQPAHWVTVLAQLHKNQTTQITKRPAGADKPKADKPADAKVMKAPDAMKVPQGPDAAKVPQAPVISKRQQHVPMKIFFLLVALSLCVSTLTGIYMAYKFARGKWLITGLLAAGVVVPLLLLPF